MTQDERLPDAAEAAAGEADVVTTSGSTGDAAPPRRRTGATRAQRSRRAKPRAETSLASGEAGAAELQSPEGGVIGEPAEQAGASHEEASAAEQECVSPKRPSRRGPRKTAAPKRTGADTSEVADPDLEPPSVLAVEHSAAAHIDGSSPETPAESAVPPSRRRTARSRRRGGTKAPADVSQPTEDGASPAEADLHAESTAPQTPLAKDAAAAQPSARKSRARPRARTIDGAAPAGGARVVVRRGVPEIAVDGKPIAPVLFFGNLGEQGSERRVLREAERAARAGVPILSTLIELICPIPPDDTVYNQVDERLQALLSAAPEAYLLPRVVFVPAPGWQHQYPHDVIHYADGPTADPSIASDRFWAEAEVALEALIEHVQRTTYGPRVLGYHLERGEWFHPAESGFDRSFANREAFRQWLRTKYKGSEVALRAAWHDGAVQLYTVEIPDAPAPEAPTETFFEARRGRRWVDFIEYTSECTADRLCALAAAVKSASGGSALVSVCYGYTFEFAHPASGHLALGRLLACPDIDIVSGPPSYAERLAGRSGAFPGPADSVALHGKVWLSEDDTRTHLSPRSGADDYNPRMDSRQATEAAHWRSVGQALACQTGIGFMDLWGDGWLDGDEMWQEAAQFVERHAGLLTHRRAASPDVVALVDERSLAHVRSGPDFLRSVLRGQRDALLRTGASVGFYLQSDVCARAFPTDARLYVFLNPYRLSADQRLAIREKLQNGGKTLVWMYAPGVAEDRGEADEAPLDVMGIAIRRQPWDSELGSRFTAARNVAIEGLQGRNMGSRRKANPSFYVDEGANAVVLAEYVQSGLPSIAIRPHAGWQSVFCGEPVLTPELARGLCRLAGVHLYTQGVDDYVYARHGWVTLITTRDGERTLTLPGSLSVYDLIAQRLLAEDVRAVRFPAQGRTTRCFFVGQRDEMVRIALPNVDRRRARRKAVSESDGTSAEDLVAPIALEPTPEEPAADVEGFSDLYEEAIADAIADSAEMEALTVPAAPSVKRRRRRRGGRGRGRKPTNATDSAPSDAASGGAPTT